MQPSHNRKQRKKAAQHVTLRINGYNIPGRIRIPLDKWRGSDREGTIKPRQNFNLRPFGYAMRTELLLAVSLRGFLMYIFT